MKTKKQLFPFLLIGILIMGVCGCMSTTVNQAEQAKDTALEYLNRNFVDTFTPLGYSDGDWAYDYETVYFTSQKYDEDVEVRIYKDQDEYILRDDYFKLTMREDAEAFFQKIVTEQGCMTETKVWFNEAVRPSWLDPHASFTEYVASGQCHIDVYFISKTAFGDDDIGAVLEKLASMKIKGVFEFVVTDDESLLSDYSIDEIVGEQRDHILEQKGYAIDQNFEISQS